MKPFVAKLAEIAPRWCSRMLACLTFPLIWVGGLVTTYEAGMAVPDWPTTYGYNLFLYPWETWIFGPWDLFIEHGHRLLGAAVGIVTIFFVVSAFLFDKRSWLKLLSIATLIAVIGQGLLGGMRVLFDDRQLAMIHGCIGPAFFAMATTLVAVTSRFWQTADTVNFPGAVHWRRMTLLIPIVAYIQLTIGATLRHLPVDVTPDFFEVMIIFHLIGATLLLVYTCRVIAVGLRHYISHPELFVPTSLLFFLVVLQVVLGISTWTVKYGWPHFLGHLQTAANYTIEAESVKQVLTVTSHVATGSLILSISVLLAIWAHRTSVQFASPGGSTKFDSDGTTAAISSRVAI